jgi:hypothetical protein
MNDNNVPRPLPSEEEEIKPDLGGKELTPAEALRRQRDTYGDDSTFPNRGDIEDEHGGGA